MKRVQGVHDLLPVAGGYQCSKCHLPVNAALVARATGAKCRAWELWAPGGPVPGSTQWSAQIAPLFSAWKINNGGVGRPPPALVLPVRRDVPAGRDPVVAGAQAAAGLRQFRAHLVVSGAGVRACIASGVSFTRRRRAEGGPCPGEGRARPVVQAALVAGAFDEAILRAGARAVALAAQRGRVVARRPREPD